MNQADARNSLLWPLSVAFYGRVESAERRNDMLRLIRDLKADRKGVTMIEYALIAGLVSVVAIAMLSAMGVTVNSLYSTINAALTSA